MVDPLTLPILLKSVDFVYTEYSKLLSERRERRKEDGERKEELEKSEKNTLSQDETLKISIDPLLWQQKEEEITHLTSLLDIHYGNYRLLSKQYAQWGEALAPLVIVNSLENEEKKITEITEELKKLLVVIYKKELE